MAAEAREAPDVVARVLDRNQIRLRELGVKLRELDPPCLITSARGSSDHAAAYLKYAAEILSGKPVASVGASVVSVYGAKLNVDRAACFTISQSGQSPDIVQVQSAAKEGGAYTVAMVNTEDSPAARQADLFLPLCAGKELSVAATKSFIASLAAAAAVISNWVEDESLIKALQNLPKALHEAANITWPRFATELVKRDSLYVLGRGPAYPIAHELALKLKETCAILAEAYSIAEVMHGPLELVDNSFTVLALIPDDAAAHLSRQTLATMKAAGANVLEIGGPDFPYARTGHMLLDPVSIIQTAYVAIEGLARARGRNPDRPRHLNKVTKTM